MFIPDPGSRISDLRSRISDPKTATNEGEKKFVVYLFCSHKNKKIKFLIHFELAKKKMWANLQRIIELSTQKIWVWDPESGKNLFRILDPGFKKAPDPRSTTLP